MIHDAKVEVTCDAKGCWSSQLYDPPYRYRDMRGSGGHYDVQDDEIEVWLVKEGWVVRDGKHYCCQDCAECAA